jgi:cell division transport system permease protein
MTIAMIITMAVSLTMVGSSALMYRQVNQMKDFYYAKLEVAIFLAGDISPEQRSQLEESIKTDPLVANYLYESKEKAYENFKKIYSDAPDLLEVVKADQLPESFRVKLKNPEQYDQIYAKYNGSEGIDVIVDQRKLLNRIFNILGSVQTMALIGAVFMALAALLLVGNTIQVAAYSKRREVAVMKLVGASNWFIQAPFVLEAVVAGLAGSLLAFLLIVLGKIFVIDGSLSSLTELLTPVTWGNVLLTLPLMAAVGGGISAVTAWVTLRFYLRV